MRERVGRPALTRFETLLLGLPISLFLGALLSDWAYFRSYEIQWANFSAWLIAGALLVGAILLLWALVASLGARRGRGRRGLFVILFAATWVVGFVNALIHARDGWAIMPTGLILSAVVAVLALASVWAGLSVESQAEDI